MGFRVKIVTIIIKIVLKIICKIDIKDLRNIPTDGPFIISMNHINFLEVPIIQVGLYPRKMRGFVKQETWNSRLMAFLMNTYKAIPVDRAGVNMKAFKEVREYLHKGNFICIAPEGHRSENGVLQKGKPGVSSMALMTKVPIIPVVHYGGEHFWKNFKKLKRTKVTFKVGPTLYLDHSVKTDSDIREKITDDIMFEMAKLLPEHMRGVYKKIPVEPSPYLHYNKP